MVGYGVERRGEDRHGVERQAGRGVDRLGLAGQGLQAWAVWQGMSAKGSAGQARRGMVGRGGGRRGLAWQAWSGGEGNGLARRGGEWQARRGGERTGKERRGMDGRGRQGAGGETGKR